MRTNHIRDVCILAKKIPSYASVQRKAIIKKKKLCFCRSSLSEAVAAAECQLHYSENEADSENEPIISPEYNEEPLPSLDGIDGSLAATPVLPDLSADSDGDDGAGVGEL